MAQSVRTEEMFHSDAALPRARASHRPDGVVVCRVGEHIREAFITGPRLLHESLFLRLARVTRDIPRGELMVCSPLFSIPSTRARAEGTENPRAGGGWRPPRRRPPLPPRN